MKSYVVVSILVLILIFVLSGGLNYILTSKNSAQVTTDTNTVRSKPCLGMKVFTQADNSGNSTEKEIPCKQISCAVWAQVNLTQQRMYLYENGKLLDTFKVSTGDRRHKTPIMDRRFGGRLYRKYTSRKFPGGDYMGLGNMPYVVFIKGGYAIHGTTPGNFAKLGKVASHGCIRLHPDHAKIFYDLIKKAGAANTWISVTY